MDKRCKTVCSSEESSFHECSNVARMERCLSVVSREDVVRKLKFDWISFAISAQVSVLVHAAASSIASGIPSTSWQISLTAERSSGFNSKPDRVWLARCTNNFTALLDSSESASLLPGIGKPLTSNTHSDCNCKGSREVTSNLTRGVPANRSRGNATQSAWPKRCSKLSSTMSASLSCKRVINWIERSEALYSTIPSASAMAVTI